MSQVLFCYTIPRSFSTDPIEVDVTIPTLPSHHKKIHGKGKNKKKKKKSNQSVSDQEHVAKRKHIRAKPKNNFEGKLIIRSGQPGTRTRQGDRKSTTLHWSRREVVKKNIDHDAKPTAGRPVRQQAEQKSNGTIRTTSKHEHRDGANGATEECRTATTQTNIGTSKRAPTCGNGHMRGKSEEDIDVDDDEGAIEHGACSGDQLWASASLHAGLPKELWGSPCASPYP
jgi:hypothetical protein